MIPKLSPRLSLALEMAEDARCLLDIGTDHAYLPAHFALKNPSAEVYGGDVGQGPLDNAKKTLLSAELGSRVCLRISDGFDAFDDISPDTVTVCGMGGTLMAEILEKKRTPFRIGDRLILQPMTHSEDVRFWLFENGFDITEEKCCLDEGRVYCCICAVFTGRTTVHSPGESYFGLLINRTDPLSRKYTAAVISRVKKRLSAIKTVNRYPEEQILLEQVAAYYERNKNNDC